ncbi:precorrin-2 C(20)-methyltransferase [Anaerosacchariphilus polymeriproducens]|uniref:Precorrin-2 C(20)-methyltransferase n=1 Tax=Anaerosacchariphilus polymeriproducens TaxID=1812858 RepID=A0A371AY89_9FIRM|nr:precorrin-2 C(20)-methyltransferase [Anaerosacchariphilus polymeriproducens]RDU24533.1 precorrin-2 C(20)-methyltransferase [Anaerosacchariphilus polymeriproducens]
MNGKLYGIGVGPGDPELLTLKALRIIKASHVVAFPGERMKDSVACQIVLQVYKELKEKVLIGITMPMTKDADKLEESHKEGADQIEELLKQGKQVAFLTLGDPTVYSTYLYIHKKIKERGYETEIVSGIPSFCAVSARLNIGLVEKAEALHIIPASYEIEEALDLPGTKVLMKAGKNMKEVKDQLIRRNKNAVMIEKCGMPDEKIYTSPEEIPEESSYYSLIIVKETI